jgi:hypothetical protein
MSITGIPLLLVYARVFSKLWLVITLITLNKPNNPNNCNKSNNPNNRNNSMNPYKLNVRLGLYEDWSITGTGFI